MKSSQDGAHPQDKTSDELLTEMTGLRDDAVAHGHDLDAMLAAVTDPMVVYDLLHEVVKTNSPFRALLQRYSYASSAATLQARADGLVLRNLQGESLPEAQLPQSRLLQGESITNDNPAQILTRGASGMDGFFRVTGEPLYRNGEVIGAVAFFRDVTEQRQVEGELTQSQGDLRQSQDELQAVFDTLSDPLFIYDASGRLIRTNAAAQQLLPTNTAEHAATPLSERAASYHVRDKQGKPLPPERWPLTRLLRGETLKGDDEATICVDLPDGRLAVLSYAGAPIRDVDGRITGYVASGRDITTRHKVEEALHRSHEELERRVAQRTEELATALHTLRHLSQRILETQENERRRIAVELHDEIGQTLTGVKMMLETMQVSAQLDSQSPHRSSAHTTLEGSAAGPQIREISAAIAKALEQVHDLSLELRPAILDSLGLLAALQWHFERYTRQTGVVVDFASRGLNQRLPIQIEAGAYRLVQEALTNVARHAGVSTVTVQAYVIEETLSLFIVDEGVGFEVDDVLTTGASTGIAGMRERADLLGGTLLVSSTPRAGTTIEAQLPLQSASPALTPMPGDGHVGAAAQAEKERNRDMARDLARDVSRDALRDATRDNTRDNTRDTARDQERDRTRDTARDIGRDVPRDVTRDAARDATRDATRDAAEQERWRRDSAQNPEEKKE